MRRLTVIPILCLFVALALWLPFQTVAQAQKAPQGSTADKLSELEKKVMILEFQVSDMRDRVASSFASLDCNSRQYHEFQFGTSKLVFFASCQKIEPYLEGHRVTLNIGNPYAFNFSAVKGKLGYGKDIWEAFGKKIEVSTAETIRGGTWHVLTVIINPSKAEEMRNLILELSAETTSAGFR